MIAAYYRRLTHPDRDVQIARRAGPGRCGRAARCRCMQDPERVKLFGADTYAIAFARIECHYFINRGFFERDDQLLRGVERDPPPALRDRARRATTSSPRSRTPGISAAPGRRQICASSPTPATP